MAGLVRDHAVDRGLEVVLDLDQGDDPTSHTQDPVVALGPTARAHMGNPKVDRDRNQENAVGHVPGPNRQKGGFSQFPSHVLLNLSFIFSLLNV